MQTEFIELNLGNKSDRIKKLENIDLEKFRKSYGDYFDDDFRDFMASFYHVSGADVLQLEKEKGDLLYVACAYGYGVKLFESLGYNSFGLDINPHYVQSCQKRNLRVKEGNAINMPFENDIFDITTSRNFLVPDYLNKEVIKKILEEQYRILKKGGIAVTYSQISDDKDYGFRWDLHDTISGQIIKNSPFSKHRLYKLEYEMHGQCFHYVDVLEK